MQINHNREYKYNVIPWPDHHLCICQQITEFLKWQNWFVWLPMVLNVFQYKQSMYIAEVVKLIQRLQLAIRERQTFIYLNQII